MAERLADIRERLAAAPSPWVRAAWDDSLILTADWAADTKPPSERGPFVAIHTTGGAEADLIAHAPTDLADLLAEVERLQGLVGDCVCGPWHPGTDGPLEDCPQHGRPYAYWVDGVTVLQSRIDAALAIHADGGRSQGYFGGPYSESDHCCTTCGEFGEYGVAWPCATVRALRGDDA